MTPPRYALGLDPGAHCGVAFVRHDKVRGVDEFKLGTNATINGRRWLKRNLDAVASWEIGGNGEELLVAVEVAEVQGPARARGAIAAAEAAGRVLEMVEAALPAWCPPIRLRRSEVMRALRARTEKQLHAQVAAMLGESYKLLGNAHERDAAAVALAALIRGGKP